MPKPIPHPSFIPHHNPFNLQYQIQIRKQLGKFHSPIHATTFPNQRKRFTNHKISSHKPLPNLFKTLEDVSSPNMMLVLFVNKSLEPSSRVLKRLGNGL